ncbi:hypothetical protein F2P81_011666 [Scophthalmus maximus]|uniref:Uncharacterized protein n=1 Tax=Scophthalmus maximus TaxID=52904 RepID=A0A6A4SZ86_SCOMX|nr:hypothetical protein F2P81_011666 [Scophthalmus maximus]
MRNESGRKETAAKNKFGILSNRTTEVECERYSRLTSSLLTQVEKRTVAPVVVSIPVGTTANSDMCMKCERHKRLLRVEKRTVAPVVVSIPVGTTANSDMCMKCERHKRLLRGLLREHVGEHKSESHDEAD